MHSLVQPDAWVALKLPNGTLRVLQVTPNTTISLGKYGSFPSNLIIHRPYHLTYELQDKRESENFNRLRIVPASELYSDILSSSTAFASPESSTPAAEDEDAEAVLPTGIEYSLVDPDSGAVVAKTDRADLDRAVLDETTRQTLSMEEIEALKEDGTDAGKDLIAKLMLSHTALDQKTEYSLAKYKLLKTKKYIRRFCVLPLDFPLLDHWLLEEKDPVKILELREEMLALLGCWANVHFGGNDPCENEDSVVKQEDAEDASAESEQTLGRWLVVDDTSGLLVGAMAERMGILYPPERGDSLEAYLETLKPKTQQRGESTSRPKAVKSEPDAKNGQGISEEGYAGIITKQEPNAASQNQPLEQVPSRKSMTSGQADSETRPKKYPTGDSKDRWNDMNVPYAQSNTLTLVHANSQPNLSYLRYYDFDVTSTSQPLTHPLATNLMTLSWLQLLDPTADTTYMAEPPAVLPDELKTWKTSRRGNYHRKRRRWARIRHVVDTARSGNFSGLVVASTMDPVSVMKHAVPLLAGGAPIAIYCQSIEPITQLIDCYSVARRAAWVSSPPAEAVGKSAEDLERWEGTEEFPLNPTLVLGASVQTSRVRKWQVLPGRTHPLMMGKGGAEGYIFTAWRVKPAEGKVEARGKGRQAKRRKVDE
ncbi:adenine-N(1)--methyltransferase non-catalytic subunit trm6 [Xylariales sp. AK1849]|nr:adenine-N(1)--methyltransferase non-catalytic subunit trm6 [Xylariales sp. AK1849]